MAAIIENKKSRKRGEPRSVDADSYPKYASTPIDDPESANEWELSVAELYGCICHRPVTALPLVRVGDTKQPKKHALPNRK